MCGGGGSAGLGDGRGAGVGAMGEGVASVQQPWSDLHAGAVPPSSVQWTHDVMHMPPTSLCLVCLLSLLSQVHQRVPLFIGSKGEVEYLESFTKAAKA